MNRQRAAVPGDRNTQERVWLFGGHSRCPSVPARGAQTAREYGLVAFRHALFAHVVRFRCPYANPPCETWKTMALLIPGRSKCRICREVIAVGESVVGFPHFIPAEHRLARFSDASVHKCCQDESPDGAELLEMRRDWRARNSRRDARTKVRLRAEADGQAQHDTTATTESSRLSVMPWTRLSLESTRQDRPPARARRTSCQTARNQWDGPLHHRRRCLLRSGRRRGASTALSVNHQPGLRRPRCFGWSFWTPVESGTPRPERYVHSARSRRNGCPTRLWP